MNRNRPLPSWLVLALAVLLDFAATMLLMRAGWVPASGGQLPWITVVAPLAAYVLLTLVAPGSASAVRRATSMAALCAMYAALTLVSAGFSAVALGPLPFDVALTRASWGSPVASLLRVVWTLLAAFPFRGLLPSHGRHGRRAGPKHAPALGRAPSPPAPTARAKPDAEAAQPRVVWEPEAWPPPAPAVQSTSALSAEEAPAPADMEAAPEASLVPLAAGPLWDAPAAGPELASHLDVEPEGTARGDDAHAPELTVEEAPAPLEAATRAEIAEEPAVTVAACPPADEAVRGSAAPDEAASEAPSSMTAAHPEESAPTPQRPNEVPASPDPVEVQWLSGAVASLDPLLSPGSPLDIDARSEPWGVLFTVLPRDLPQEPLVGVAARLLPALIGSSGADAPHAVDQVTLRGSEGAFVVTPLGSVGERGCLLMTGTRRRGALALLEILSRRAASEYRAAYQYSASPLPEAPISLSRPALKPSEPPAQLGRVAECLEAFGPVAPAAYHEASGDLVLYLFVAPGTKVHDLGRIVCDLHHAVESEGRGQGIGALQSMTFQLAGLRVFVKPVPVTSGSGVSLLAVGGPVGRPGLAHLQVERAVARLAMLDVRWG